MSKANQIECLWIAGYTIHGIAAKVPVHPRSVRMTVKERGLPPRMPGNTRRANMWPYIVAWIKAGYSEQEIKAGLGYRCE